MARRVGDVVCCFFKVLELDSIDAEEAFLFLVFTTVSEESSFACWNSTAVGVSGENQEEGVVEPALLLLFVSMSEVMVVAV